MICTILEIKKHKGKITDFLLNKKVYKKQLWCSHKNTVIHYFQPYLWSLFLKIDRHFSVTAKIGPLSMSNCKWSHRDISHRKHQRSKFNNPTNKPAVLTACFHMTQYHTATLLVLEGPITCVINDCCLSCLLTRTSLVKEEERKWAPSLFSLSALFKTMSVPTSNL